MSEAIKAQFQKAKNENRPALVTFITAGHPSPDETVGVLKALQEGGVDIIELGVPFTDPIADGPVIQHANTVALSHNVSFYDTLEYVRRARAEGVTIPILLMGYYNPILNIGEQKVVRLAREAGANGFIVVDLPPEEAVKFREYSAQEGLSYIPLIAPSTPDDRIKFLAANIADSFIYVVSRMGITGASNKLSNSLPNFLAHIKELTSQVPNGKDIPIAVGFGVSSHQHFTDVGSIADGVVIGSKLVSCLDAAQPGEAPLAASTFVKSILIGDGKDAAAQADPVAAAAANATTAAQAKTVEAVASQIGTKDTNPVHQFADRFGEFGGQYVPEVLVECLAELEAGFESAVNDPEFWKEYRSYYDYMGRPGHLHLADRLTEHAGGANIYLKREDLNHTGSHKINNALGQILIAKRLGKTRVIAETGAGQHGVATATVAAKFGMKCTVYMGAEDVRRQALNVFRIKLLGAEVVPVESGSRTLRDAVNEALRCWVTDLSTTHYIIGSAIGPHPYPTIVRTFQSVIGQETKEQMLEKTGRLPDAVIACVGGGSNAVGMFYPFEKDLSVKMIGVEAGGEGLDTKHHSATLSLGRPGVLHGVKTFLLQDENGQVTETHSVSAGLDYPGVGPELANWKFTGRAQFIAADDAQALQGFRLLSQLEGIIPALESAHAVWGAVETAKQMGKGKNIVICLSGRGDKDVVSVAENLPTLGPKIGWDLRFEETDPEKRKA